MGTKYEIKCLNKKNVYCDPIKIIDFVLKKSYQQLEGTIYINGNKIIRNYLIVYNC